MLASGDDTRSAAALLSKVFDRAWSRLDAIAGVRRFARFRIKNQSKTPQIFFAGLPPRTPCGGGYAYMYRMRYNFSSRRKGAIFSFVIRKCYSFG